MPHHNQVNEGDCVELDAPPHHHAHHIDEDHGDDDEGDQASPHTEAGQDKQDDEHSPQRREKGHHRAVPHRQVLLVVHVEDTAEECAGLSWNSFRRSQDLNLLVFYDL